MNFQFWQKIIQCGWSTPEEDIDDIVIDDDFIYSLSYLEGLDFNLFDDDTIFLLYNESPSYKEEKNIIRRLIANGISKERMVKIISENDDDGVSEIYKTIEDEHSVYSSDLENLSEEDILIYNKFIDIEDENYALFKKALNFEEYIKYNIKNELEFDEDDIIKIVNNHLHLITIDVAISNFFMNSLENISSNKNGFYRDTYETKIETVNIIFEHFDYDEELMKTYFDKICDVYEESFNDILIMSQIKKDQKESEREDRCNNRISIDEAQEYLDNNEFSVNILISKGYIGLEDMTFDSLTIDDELQCSSSNGRGGMSAWYSGRDFGDNQMSKDWFFELVNKYKKEIE